MEDHCREGNTVQDPWGCTPPDKRGQRCDQQFDIDSRRGDRNAMPLVGEHPRIRDVAVHAWREAHEQQSHGVALATEVFAGQAMPKFMQNLHDSNGQPEPEDVLQVEECMKVLQFWLTRELFKAGGN